jgi:hypothetical protein
MDAAAAAAAANKTASTVSASVLSNSAGAAIDVVGFMTKFTLAGQPAPGKKPGGNWGNIVLFEDVTFSAKPKRGYKKGDPLETYEFKAGTIVNAKSWDVSQVPLGTAVVFRGCVYDVSEDGKYKSVIFKGVVLATEHVFTYVHKIPFAARSVVPKRDLWLGSDYAIDGPATNFMVVIDQCGAAVERDALAFEGGGIVGKFALPPDGMNPTWFTYQNKKSEMCPGLIGGLEGTVAKHNNIRVFQAEPDKPVISFLAVAKLYKQDVWGMQLTNELWYALAPNITPGLRGLLTATIDRSRTALVNFEPTPDILGACTIWSSFTWDADATLRRVGIQVDSAYAWSLVSDFTKDFGPDPELRFATTDVAINLSTAAANGFGVDRLVASSDVDFYVVGNWYFDLAEVKAANAKSADERAKIVRGRSETATDASLAKYRGEPVRVVYAVSKLGKPGIAALVDPPATGAKRSRA